MLSNGVHLFCLLVIQVLDSCCSASIEQGEDLLLPHPLASNVFYDNIASGELNASRPLTFHVHYRPVASNFTPTQRRKLVEARRLFLRSTSTYNKDDAVAPTSHDVFVDVDLYGKFTSLGYYYTYLHVGDPEQFFTVIMDTGSVVTAIPCEGCKDCGKHSGGHKVPHNHGTETGVFVVKKSTSALVVGTKFAQSYTEGSSLSGYVRKLSLLLYCHTIYIYIYICICIYTHTYTYIHICVCVCVKCCIATVQQNNMYSRSHFFDATINCICVFKHAFIFLFFL